jgi:CubicO group peptidase (beta-lactamase class C family)
MNASSSVEQWPCDIHLPGKGSFARGESHARATLEAMVKAGKLPGAQYLAVTAGDTLLDLHVGHADVLTERKMERDTLQMSYSVTKVITAISVMQLVDQEKLALDCPLSDYYVDHPYGSALTLRMLLAHTGGVPNPMPLDWFALEGEQMERDERLHTILAASRLSHEPGTRHRYSNIGYWLLEKAIEAASDMDYASYVRERVFAAVSVPEQAATFELPARDLTAVGHSRRFTPMNVVLWAMTPSRYWAEPDGGWSRAARIQPHGRAYGGLFASAAALAPVLKDLMADTPRLISSRARDLMFSAQRTRNGKDTGETLGWVRGKLHGTPYFGKQGGGFGFHGNVRVYPTLGLATVFLANRTEISPAPIDARSDALDEEFVRGHSSAAANI